MGCICSKQVLLEWRCAHFTIIVNPHQHHYVSHFWSIWNADSQLRPLADRITHSNSYDIAVRRLYTNRTPVMRQQVDAFISEIMDRPYKTNLLTLFNASVETRAKLLGYVIFIQHFLYPSWNWRISQYFDSETRACVQFDSERLGRRLEMTMHDLEQIRSELESQQLSDLQRSTLNSEV